MHVRDHQVPFFIEEWFKNVSNDQRAINHSLIPANKIFATHSNQRIQCLDMCAQTSIRVSASNTLIPQEIRSKLAAIQPGFDVVFQTVGAILELTRALRYSIQYQIPLAINVRQFSGSSSCQDSTRYVTELLRPNVNSYTAQASDLE